MKASIQGNPALFATQYELNREYGGSWLYGKFCYWIGGVQVCDYELGVSLRDILIILSEVTRDIGKRTDPKLFNLSAEELYRCLHSSLYEPQSEFEKTGLEECWARFQIGLGIDICDNWKVYLVESDTKARIIYSYLDGSIVETKLPLGFFDEVISRTYHEINEMYISELRNSGIDFDNI
jgi:hypothetical protein